ncbi:hypothetical protein DUNSADRAFT_14398 [Dunaliella salina]|uniref:Essential protein Yae1 N-terminal domain-containing protein n=1 Tax=Dunaliella salina TaxID=3046 RepID=A0ABQ7G7C8_DUNSA|nr:hypothetical protein DUNSADRAFT_14398 [Dunaliella salina]|eukprot:KAF5830513.1 hypothetical protein DUNSADRAFT_14398 [Dunaliella salina]
MDDIFEPVHRVVDNSVQEGHADGLRDGMVEGIVEGRELGLQKGYEMGIEVGFYAGCVRTWRYLQAMDYSRQQAKTTSTTEGDPSAPASMSQDRNLDVKRGKQPKAAEDGEAGGQGCGSLLIPERAERGLAILEELLAAFPIDNPQDETLQDLFERLRGRFKATASMMGLLQDYFPREPEEEDRRQAGGDLSF